MHCQSHYICKLFLFVCFRQQKFHSDQAESFISYFCIKCSHQITIGKNKRLARINFCSLFLKLLWTKVWLLILILWMFCRSIWILEGKTLKLNRVGSGWLLTEHLSFHLQKISPSMLDHEQQCCQNYSQFTS